MCELFGGSDASPADQVPDRAIDVPPDSSGTAQSVVLGGGFLYYAVRLMNPPNEQFAMETFRYSIIYLMALFAFLLVDHYLSPPVPMHTPTAVMEFERIG